MRRLYPVVYLVYKRSRALSSYLSAKRYYQYPQSLINTFTRPAIMSFVWNILLKLCIFAVVKNGSFLCAKCFNEPYFSSALRGTKLEIPAGTAKRLTKIFFLSPEPIYDTPKLVRFEIIWLPLGLFLRTKSWKRNRLNKSAWKLSGILR